MSHFDHPVQVSIIQLAPLSPKKNTILYKERELGFGMRTLTPNPDKKRWKELSLPVSLTVCHCCWFGCECLSHCLLDPELLTPFIVHVEEMRLKVPHLVTQSQNHVFFTFMLSPGPGEC